MKHKPINMLCTFSPRSILKDCGTLHAESSFDCGTNNMARSHLTLLNNIWKKEQLQIKYKDLAVSGRGGFYMSELFFPCARKKKKKKN